MPAGTVNLADVIAAVAQRHGRAPALTDAHETLTYASFMDRAAAAAGALQGEGISAAQRIGLAYQRDIDCLCLILACWLIGAVPVPLDFRTRRQQRSEIARDMALSVIVEQRPAAGTGDTYPALRLDLSALPPPRLRLRPDTPDAPAMISLTSGTTGRPAGIVLSHEALYCRLIAYRESYPAFPGSHFLNLYPVGFSASRNMCLISLVNGGQVTMMPPLAGAREVAEAIGSRGITGLYVVPASLEALVNLDGVQPLSGLGFLGFGSGFSAPDLKRRAHDVLTPRLVEVFSSSISGGISALFGGDVVTHGNTVGRPFAHALVDIVDGAGASLEADAIGAVRVRTPGMASAVIGAEDRTESDRVVDGWVMTGDLGCIRSDGYVELKGRASDLIIRGGANVYPEEVERVLTAHPGVREAAVIGVPHPTLGEDIVAFVSGAVDVKELQGHCIARLNADKRPREFIVVAALPRNANGKVVRSALRAQFDAAGTGASASHG